MRQGKEGFSLVEVTLAIGVAAFCLLTVLGLLPVAQQGHQAASQQGVMSSLASEIISDLKATQRTLPASQQNSPRFGLIVGIAGSGSSTQTLFFTEDGQTIGPPNTSAVGANPAPRYRATVFLTTPASGRTATIGRALITWPALADPDPATAPVKYNGSLETFVALDRN